MENMIDFCTCKIQDPENECYIGNNPIWTKLPDPDFEVENAKELEMSDKKLLELSKRFTVISSIGDGPMGKISNVYHEKCSKVIHPNILAYWYGFKKLKLKLKEDFDLK